jgi:NitT/TauT family transport system ATP-binding protein
VNHQDRRAVESTAGSVNDEVVVALGISQWFADRSSGTRFQALDQVSLIVKAGERVVLFGPSGCGKSTLLEVIAGLQRPAEGAVSVLGRSVEGPRSDVPIVFQQYALFPWKTALGNVAFGLQLNGVPRRKRVAEAMHYLEVVHLSHVRDHYIWQLSGGMRQRVAIARALVGKPKVWLMDEPFAALDAITRGSLQHQFLDIARQVGGSVVFVTHSIDEAMFIGQKIVVMAANPGRIVDIIVVDDYSDGSGVVGSDGEAAIRDRAHKMLAVGSGSTAGRLASSVRKW